MPVKTFVLIRSSCLRPCAWNPLCSNGPPRSCCSLTTLSSKLWPMLLLYSMGFASAVRRFQFSGHTPLLRRVRWLDHVWDWRTTGEDSSPFWPELIGNRPASAMSSHAHRSAASLTRPPRRSPSTCTPSTAPQRMPIRCPLCVAMGKQRDLEGTALTREADPLGSRATRSVSQASSWKTIQSMRHMLQA